MTSRSDGPSDRRVPLRTCIGCRTRRPQTELVRCVLGRDGIACVDRHGPGRGAWLCGSQCLDVAVRRKAFDRAWRTTLRAGQLEGLAGELDRRRSG